MNDKDKTIKKKGKLIIRNNDHLFDLNRISWQPRGELTQSDWEEIGEALGQLKSSSQWWIGDWWVYGEHRYGDRKAIIDSDDWSGVSYSTCQDYATVCRTFTISQRLDVLSFSHHSKVVSLPEEWRTKLLNWACEPLREGQLKPHSVRVLEQKVKEVKRQLELEDHSKSNQPTEQLVEQKVQELQKVGEAKELATKINNQWQSEILKLQEIKQELDQQSLLLRKKEQKLQNIDPQANSQAKIIAQKEIEEQKAMFEKQQKYLSTAEDIAKQIKDISWYFQNALKNLESHTKPDEYQPEDLAKNFPEEYQKTTANLLEAVHEMKCFADRILDIYTTETTTIIDI